MSDDTPSPLNNVITIDDERIKSHLDRVVRGTVEETLNTLLCRPSALVGQNELIA
jgi:putative transposase